MATLAQISTESKRALMTDAPDIAASAAAMARSDPVIREVLRDYDSILMQLLLERGAGRGDRDLEAIRAGLIAELRRAVRRGQEQRACCAGRGPTRIRTQGHESPDRMRRRTIDR